MFDLLTDPRSLICLVIAASLGYFAWTDPNGFFTFLGTVAKLLVAVVSGFASCFTVVVDKQGDGNGPNPAPSPRSMEWIDALDGAIWA